MSADNFTLDINAARANSVKRTPTLDPLSKSKSSQGNTSECGSSRQVSSIGQPTSSFGSTSEQATPKLTSATTFAQANSSSNGISVGLQRRTTKDLIDIFENKAPSKLPTASPASYPLRRGIANQRFNAPLPDLPKSGQLRQSFRNLISVFSKAKKASSETATYTRPKHDLRQSTVSNGGISSHSKYSQSTVDENSMTIPQPTMPTLSRMAPKLPSVCSTQRSIE
jgi:hypothetical protein